MQNKRTGKPTGKPTGKSTVGKYIKQKSDTIKPYGRREETGKSDSRRPDTNKPYGRREESGKSDSRRPDNRRPEVNKNEAERPVKKIKSKCPISKKCGGCQYLDTPYADQLEIKQRNLRIRLEPFGKPEKIIGMEDPFYYRNKVTAVFKRKKDGSIESGVYEEGTHNVLPVTKCYIENRKAGEIIRTIAGLLKSFKITIYNEDSGYGLLRHVMVRTGEKSGQILVVMVTSAPVFPSKNNFVKALLEVHPEITTIVQNINEKQTSVVLGYKENVMYGKGYIEDTCCGKTFRISPRSFYQINPVQTEVLYRKAVELAQLTGKEKVLDAYCGIGTIGIIASDGAKEVIGVELNRDAIADAKINAKINQVKNITFYSNDAGRFMTELAEQNVEMDVVFMDPPRSGSDEAFLNALLKLAPDRVVYISCGPESLANDLKVLTKGVGKGAEKVSYQVEKICPVDMFPHTVHIECIACIQKIQ